METTEASKKAIMKWYHYIAAFFAGAFLANFVPHFVNGISGDAFPSPFANPPGKGLSSPLINVLWALLNLLIGFILLRVSRMTYKSNWALLVFFIGVALMSIQLGMHFEHKMTHP